MKSKLAFGVGLYDKGKHKAWEDGKPGKAYIAWKGIIQRCYDPNVQAKYPTYIGCTVCPEWLEFQVFADWYEANYPNDGEHYQLDKDLKVVGNKIYSPSACLFVSGVVNNFTIDRGAMRGEYLIGAASHKASGKLQAGCRNPFTGKGEHLGLFTDELEAHLAWRKRKSELTYELAMAQDNPEVRDALLRWKLALDNNEIHTV